MSMGEVRGKTFVKLMEALVHGISINIWGRSVERLKRLDCIDQVVGGGVGVGAKAVCISLRRIRR